MGVGECIVAIFAIRCLYLIITKVLDLLENKTNQPKEEIKKDFALITDDITFKDLSSL